jgi:FkbM family methyltransferase
MVFLQRFLRSGDIFFDVGANAGAYAVLAGGIGCEVTAIEPIPQTFAKLTENISLNLKVGDINALNVAVSSAPGVLRMTTGFGSGNHILNPGEQADSVEVAVTTLDILTRDGHAPTFIKMDVEGHEVEVLKGALSTLRSSRLTGLLVETFRPHNWRNKSLQELESILRDNGFFPFGYDIESNELFPLVNPEDGENNTFYFRSIDLIRERLAENFLRNAPL